MSTNQQIRNPICNLSKRDLVEPSIATLELILDNFVDDDCLFCTNKLMFVKSIKNCSYVYSFFHKKWILNLNKDTDQLITRVDIVTILIHLDSINN